MPRVVVFDEFGGPEVLRTLCEPVPVPLDGEVRIRVDAFAVNPLDAMMRSGRSPGPVPLPHARIGIEAVGVVDALGPAVSAFGVGDAVLVAAVPEATVRGTYAEYTVLPASAVVARPPGLDLHEAAAVWVAFSTAYGALVEVAGVRAGDTVLVSGASGAVGRAAIQVAARVGAVSLAITRDSRRTTELLAAGATAVIATDRDDLVDAVRRHTGGLGTDVALDLVRGPGQRDLLAATRPGGALVAAGYLDPRPTPEPTDGAVTVHRYRGWDHLLDLDELARMTAFLADGLRAGALRPAIDSVFAFDDVVEAHRRLERGQHAGKIVVTV